MKQITLNIDGREIEATITAEDAAKITEWPRVGDKVWTIMYDGELRRFTYANDEIDLNTADLGNMFRTREDAEKEVRARNLVAEIQKRRKELNGDWVPDWSDGDTEKYEICMATDEERPLVDCTWYTNSAPVFGHFKRRRDLEDVIEEFKDELIWYFTEYANS